MSNFYIAFAVYLNLIFIAAKLWDKVDWSWLWIMTPISILTVIGLIASVGKSSGRRKSNGNLVKNIQALRDLIESSKSKERQGSKH